MRRSKITNEQIIESFREVHLNKYDYSLVEYTTMHNKVKIICETHGIFEQTPNAHIRQKQDCPKCSIITNTLRQKGTTESFIQKAKIKHGNRYNYSQVEYGNTAHDKVKIICKQHGVFEMSPNSHLSKGTNCPECMKKNTGWAKTSWENSCKGKVAKLYIIKCYNENEEFYKIGITNKKTIKERFYHKSLMPYKYKIIKIIESKKDPIYIYNLERHLHLIHKKVKYKPLIQFAGETECFSEIFVNENIR